jgi:hypothetical protein
MRLLSALEARRYRGAFRRRGGLGSGSGRGPQPAMIMAHSRALALSVMPGKNRRNSMAADSSPPRSKAARIAAASASLTMNILTVSGLGAEPARRVHNHYFQNAATNVTKIPSARPDTRIASPPVISPPATSIRRVLYLHRSQRTPAAGQARTAHQPARTGDETAACEHCLTIAVAQLHAATNVE